MSKGFTHETAVGASVEWYTPKSVFDALGVKFDLDPCTPGGGLTRVPADSHYTKKEDGLESEWFGRIRFHPWHKDAPNNGSPGVGNVFIAWGKWSASVLNAANIDGAKFERKIA